jgi:hypothetical protein
VAFAARRDVGDFRHCNGYGCSKARHCKDADRAGSTPAGVCETLKAKKRPVEANRRLHRVVGVDQGEAPWLGESFRAPLATAGVGLETNVCDASPLLEAL